MSIELKPDLQKYIDEQVRSGVYDSPEGVVEAGLAVLRPQKREATFAPGELDALLAERMADVERGEIYDGEAFFRDLDEMGAARRREQTK